ncbi:hypothetical protein APY04_3089 [Hyphomicrobium sulfonivorans]|uniref:Tyr recombinase domain-containing protein n=1 Tax=Hyphomicrobium sulfonivorans TaxID=121290 RepID=A0A109B9U8_HYPSL|nr:hypothetical protein [Hyphomicrobium sulfonivorans]KWT64849.1 hypothetical protein APY04_3089 [Hyphomicrobium sulfonivorans]
MGIVKNRHGTYVVRKKVPKGHEEAVAKVLGDGRQRIAWLQRSLGTKDLRIANIAAKPFLIEFDEVLAKAAALMSPMPQRDNLSDGEVTMMADYFYASLLSEDDDVRRDGAGSQQLYQDIAGDLAAQGASGRMVFDPDEAAPPYGMSQREFEKHKSTVDFVLPAARAALARGDISFVDDELDELTEVFRIQLDPASKAYRALGAAVLKRFVQHLEALAGRNAGEVIETPKFIEPSISAPRRPASAASADNDTLSAAYEGWKKARPPVASTDREFYNAIQRFIELHGDMRIEDIRRSHVREYREALQMIPVRRSGPLRNAKLPELVKWATERPAAPRLQPSSVNKLLGGMQAIVVWGYDNGFIPDDKIWADPFARMRVDEPEPDPVLWNTDQLKQLFGSSVFTEGDRPDGGGGEAAYWMPLLALFTGARQSELAALTADDVETDLPTGVRYFRIVEDRERGAGLKTTSSRRVVPEHPELVRLGFFDYLDGRRRNGGPKAPLFPLLEKGPRDGFAERWSKWFGRYLGKLNIKGVDAPVFHSFRHNFKDALRWKGESEDVNDALTGHSGGGVGRRYGAKDKARRFGMERLADAEMLQAAGKKLEGQATTLARSSDRLSSGHLRLAEAARKAQNSLTGQVMAMRNMLPAMTLATVVTAAKRVADMATEANRLAQELQMPVERLSALRYAAQASSVPVEALSTSVRTLNTRLAEMSGGAANATSRALRLMGVEALDANGRLREQSEVLLDIATKFSSYADGAKKVALATSLFGESGSAMLPMLNRGRDGIRQLTAEADRFGLTLNSKTTAAALEFNANLRQLRSRLDGLTIQIGGPALAAVNALTASIIEAAEAQKKWSATPIPSWFSGGAGGSAGAMQGALDAIGWAGKSPTDRFTELQNAVAELRALDPLKIDAPVVNTEAYDRLIEQLTKRSEALKVEAATFGMSEAAAVRYRVENELLRASQEANMTLTPALLDEHRRIASGLAGTTAQLAAMRVEAENRTPFENLTAELVHLKSLVDENALSWDQYERAAARAAENAGLAWHQTADTIIGSIVAVARASGESNKTMTKVAQVAGVAQALINTHVAVSKALASAAPPWNFALAAAVAAQGFASVAAIRSQSTSIGSISTPSMSSASSAPAQIPTATNDKPTQPATTIVINGERFGYKEIEELVERLSEHGRDGGRIVVQRGSDW